MRYPVVAGRFYESEGDTLQRQISKCFQHRHGPGPLTDPGTSREIVGMLAPHAGYMASGPAQAHSYHAILADGLPDLYVVIGPGHSGRGAPVAVSDEDFWTPLGVCETDMDVVSRLKGIVEVDRRAHMQEHSVEVQMPFIQTIDPSPKVVAVVMNAQDMESAAETARSLRDACEGMDVLYIASSDLSHYVPKEKANREDMKVLDKVVDLDVAGMYDTIRRLGVTACGFGPIAAAMMASQPSRSKLLKYMDSGDTVGMGDVVGYAAVSFLR